MKKRMLALTLAVGLSLGIPASAHAETRSEIRTVNGCKIWSEVYESHHSYKAAAWVQAGSGTIPAGSVQVQSVLFHANGEIRRCGRSMAAESPFHAVDTGYGYVRQGDVYSLGLVYFRDSAGGYTLSETAPVTGKNPDRPETPPEIAPIQVNARGETYGSLLAAKSPEEYPDLIAAVGTEGQSGYLRREDFIALDPLCGDAEYGGRALHLYDLEGTGIGVFSVEFPHTCPSGMDAKTVRAQMGAGTEEEQHLWTLAEKTLVDGDYPVNAKGQTYGPHLLRDLMGYTTDLTPAVNDDDVRGYVASHKELPISAEEMAVLQAATSEPLYDKDGNVIGVFEWCSPTPIDTAGKTLEQVKEELARGGGEE